MAGKIAVKFYGIMRRRLGTASMEIAADDLTLMALLRLTEERSGHRFLDELLDRDQGLLTGTIILVNGENIRSGKGLETRIKDGDSVDLFSPAGGG